VSILDLLPTHPGMGCNVIVTLRMESRAVGGRGLFTDGEVLRGRKNPCELASFAFCTIREGLRVVYKHMFVRRNKSLGGGDSYVKVTGKHMLVKLKGLKSVLWFR